MNKLSWQILGACLVCLWVGFLIGEFQRYKWEVRCHGFGYTSVNYHGGQPYCHKQIGVTPVNVRLEDLTWLKQ